VKNNIEQSMSKLLLLVCFITLVGCAAGMVGVYKGEVGANESALYNLDPYSEDSPDEARKRKLFVHNIAEAKRN